MAKVGFSTGCLHKTNLPLGERVQLFREAGADAIELSFGSLPELMAFELDHQLASYLSKFSHVSIHAPWHMRYNKDYDTSKALRKLSDIFKETHPSGIVIHPDTIGDYSRLTDFGLPFLFENMDPKKDFGRFPIDFEVLKREHDYGFVLDVFHAYENDTSMELARRFLDTMGNRLKHLHVSGINGIKRHASCYNANNLQSIIDIIKLSNNVARISEGQITEDIEYTLFQELRFLKEQ